MLKQQGGCCVFLHASNPPLLFAASDVMHLQRQFETAKHMEANFFLNFASYKEKANVCACLYKRAHGGLI